MILYQPERGYCYNSDSIFLFDFIDSFSPKGSMLDVGAGCGVVGLLVAKHNPKVSLEAVEKQEIFTHYARNNARVNEISYKLHHSDFLELDESVKYDYIVSNPPFYHDGVSKSEDEMLYAARYNLNLPIEQFFKKVNRLLKPQGHFIFCYDASQFGLLCKELYNVKIPPVDVRFVHPKIDKKASLVMIHARNGSKSMMHIMPPLISFENEEFTPMAKSIYKKAATQSIKCSL
ncbi:MAG: methyltransferase [Epsilonproteobacteria bacterium]|nr:methyltransferase [Campylobacterota bacterium]